tara:strand:+ start:172 stop:537 length:366 start_codon:yes stop_codon:yes gene_type:complete
MTSVKIILSVASTGIIFYYTNLNTIINNANGNGEHFNKNTLLGYIINHDPGYVCPLGILLGKMMIIAGIIQIYYIYFNQYEYIKNINVMLLVCSVMLSFLNTDLQRNIFIAFILQMILIII